MPSHIQSLKTSYSVLLMLICTSVTQKEGKVVYGVKMTATSISTALNIENCGNKYTEQLRIFISLVSLQNTRAGNLECQSLGRNSSEENFRIPFFKESTEPSTLCRKFIQGFLVTSGDIFYH